VRIIHVVTLVAPNGAFGGPVRVALNLASELQSQGHEVIVVGSTRDYDPIPRTVGGVRVRLWRARQAIPFAGFLGIFVPELFMWMWRNRRDIDVVHVHMSRDMVSLPAAALALILRKGLVVQTHGMVVESDHWFAPLLDQLLTRPVLSRASAVLFLTEQERRGLSHVSHRARLHRLLNGVPRSEAPRTADIAAEIPEALYLARLHERKRPVLFVEAAAELLKLGVSASFALVGPDQGEGDNVRRAIEGLGDLAAYVRWEGALPLEATLARMRDASIYVLPSVQEPFPMAVLEAMSVGLPVIVTDSCGLADVIAATGCGIVVDETQESLVDAMRCLLVDEAARHRMSQAAMTAALEQCDMTTIGQQLLDIYERANVSRSETSTKATTE